jgi:hypothetical protein
VFFWVRLADPDAPQYNAAAVIYKCAMLNTYKPKPKINTRKNLISGEYVDARVTQELQEAEQRAAAASTAVSVTDVVRDLKATPVEIVSVCLQ